MYRDQRETYLSLFVPRDGLELLPGSTFFVTPLRVGSASAVAAVAICFLAAFEGSCSSEYFANSSPILAFLSAIGIRLTRISIRVLNPCACSEYCARSFLARSETAQPSKVSFYLYHSRRHSRGRRRQDLGNEKRVLSNCRLSINACFCACVIAFRLF